METEEEDDEFVDGGWCVGGGGNADDTKIDAQQDVDA